jgi:lipopolysaccharide biosynthesis glycosyltransferase
LTVSATDLSNCIEHSALFGDPQSGTPRTALHIGFGIDAAFARPMGVAMTSVCEHNAALALHFHVITTGIAPGDLDKLQVVAEQYRVTIALYTINSHLFERLPHNNNISIASYFRLLFPKVVAADRLLYLDGDILCVKSLLPLAEMPLPEQTLVAAAPDAERTANARMAALNLPHYFNSGVLLMDLRRWNDAMISEQALTVLLDDPACCKYHDQDALNIVLAGKTAYLPQRLNHIVHGTLEHAQDAVLLHLVANPKPWSIACADQQVQRFYLACEQQSPWAGLPLELPRNCRQMRYYSRKLWLEGRYLSAMCWYAAYAQDKWLPKRAGRG